MGRSAVASAPPARPAGGPRRHRAASGAGELDPSGDSGACLTLRCLAVSTGTCAPAGGTPLAALFLLEKCSAAPAGRKLLTALFLLGEMPRDCIY